jgi:DNA (cytosine-5)-methyltransferase 1
VSSKWSKGTGGPAGDEHYNLVTAIGPVTHALGTGSKGGCATVAVATTTMAVRRLLPVECERLQGFPDDHTLIPWKGKPASECPDGPRYKAMGNSFAVPVVRWIGTRLDALVKGTL